MLSALLAGLGEEAFFSQVYEQRVWRGRSEGSVLLSLIGSASVRALATSDDARFPSVALASGDAEISPSTYSQHRRIIGTKLLAAHAEGATIVLADVAKRVPALAAAARELGRSFGVRVGVNAYLSPPGARGFAPHWDTHDVLVVQIEGSKVWELYATPEPMPLTRFRDAGRPAGEVVDRFTLHAGEVLYVPSGHIHAARATDDPSLHLTLGLHPLRVLDAAVEAVAAHALGHPSVRRALRPDGNAASAVAAALRAAAEDAEAIAAAIAVAEQELARRRGE